jgi:CHAD domain-containing protein
MTFILNPEQSIQANMSRIATGQLSTARAHLTDPQDGDLHENIHEARKCFKRLRGLLRMVRPVLDRSIYLQENIRFRDAARSLSAVRDAQALVECYDMLEGAFGLRVDFRRLQPLRDRLVVRRTSSTCAQSDLEARAGKVVESLDDARTAIAGWQLEDADWNDLARGLQHVYRRARKAWRRARHQDDPAELHDWRKSAKYLRYQFQLLQGVAGDWAEAQCQGFQELSYLLGDHHDLEMLRDMLDKMEATGLDPVAESECRILLREHKDSLYREALALGQSLLKQKPSELRWWARRRL